MRENIIALLNNSWVVGISTGLIVCLISTSITLIRKKIVKKKRINEAYKKCIVILLSYIDKNEVPSDTAVLAVINVVASQYKINPQMLNIKKILEELLVKVISLEKYSVRKSKKLITTLENEINKLDINKINIIQVLQDNKDLIDIVNDVLVLDHGFEDIAENLSQLLENKFEKHSVIYDIVVNVLIFVVVAVPSIFFSDFYSVLISAPSTIAIITLCVTQIFYRND